MTAVVLRRTDPLGEFAVRELDPGGDAALLHGWLTHPKSVFWQMQDADEWAVAAYFAEIAGSPDREAFVGLWNGVPAYLVERYDPAHDPVGKVYDVQPGDVGMHFLVAPTERPVHGFTQAVIVTVMELLWRDPSTRRVVVEPDVRNRPVHALNAAVGFQVVDTVALPDKEALLSMCTRQQYEEQRRSSSDLASVSRGQHRP
jgi:RimJ/RimL family protein N-acetyltransferase